MDPLQRVDGEQEGPPPFEELEEQGPIVPDELGFDADIYQATVGEPLLVTVVRTGGSTRAVSVRVNILGGPAGTAFLQPPTNQVRLDFAPGVLKQTFVLTPSASTSALRLELVVPAPERPGIVAATVHIADPQPQCADTTVLQKVLLWIGAWQVIGFIGDTDGATCGRPTTYTFPLYSAGMPVPPAGTFAWVGPNPNSIAPDSVEVALSPTPGDFQYWRSSASLADCGTLVDMTSCAGPTGCSLDWATSPVSGRCVVSPSEGQWYLSFRFASASGQYACSSGAAGLPCSLGFYYRDY